VPNESYAKKLVALRHELEGDQKRLEEMTAPGRSSISTAAIATLSLSTSSS
jgi:hypothetical protein